MTYRLHLNPTHVRKGPFSLSAFDITPTKDNPWLEKWPKGLKGWCWVSYKIHLDKPIVSLEWSVHKAYIHFRWFIGLSSTKALHVEKTIYFKSITAYAARREPTKVSVVNQDETLVWF
jgi:hypothetical protein